MSDIALRVEDLSKRYRLGQVGMTTLHEDVARWWAVLRGRPDPTLKVTSRNIRSEAHSGSNHVWALRDVSFELKHGEVLGIIGRNGSGKSTLLKLLSRVTAPTSGRAMMKGRVGSLLEVGTGFHPELTGRENIFLNGAILGMTKAEVQSRLDEIVEFSGCARYIDTPVKRYSSGMMVRLGFAVAAHLEPEILIVDEVLAVGDLVFQEKCIGKMQDVAGHGRTVLFVSHNMNTIAELCGKAMLLVDGMRANLGPVDEVISDYVRHRVEGNERTEIPPEWHRTTSPLQIDVVELTNDAGEAKNTFAFGEAVNVRMEYRSAQAYRRVSFGMELYRSGFCLTEFLLRGRPVERDADRKTVVCRLPHRNLKPGFYELSFGVNDEERGHALDWLTHVVSFEVSPKQLGRGRPERLPHGIVKLDAEWRDADGRLLADPSEEDA